MPVVVIRLVQVEQLIGRGIQLGATEIERVNRHRLAVEGIEPDIFLRFFGLQSYSSSKDAREIIWCDLISAITQFVSW